MVSGNMGNSQTWWLRNRRSRRPFGVTVCHTLENLHWKDNSKAYAWQVSFMIPLRSWAHTYPQVLSSPSPQITFNLKVARFCSSNAPIVVFIALGQPKWRQRAGLRGEHENNPPGTRSPPLPRWLPPSLHPILNLLPLRHLHLPILLHRVP